MSLNKKTVIDVSLGQIDNLGRQLSKHGITGNFNRHTLIAWFLYGQQRFEGEKTRLALQVSLRKRQIKQLKDKANALVNHNKSKAA